jgi:glycosyltransferase involved in cell wall biosynthesis
VGALVKTPRVSMGMPVYNGEKYLAEAIESVLGQTFGDFELVISDNGSSDGTRGICERYAAREPRVRYFRSDVNRGATWNFNRVVELARGEYFRWAAHDDRIRPEYLERCVAVLDAEPEVVLCYTQVEIIDADGASRGVYQDKPLQTGAPRPSRRFRDLIAGHRCFEIFGLIRLSALRSVSPLGAYGHADGILLSRLALLGPFREIAEPLFAERMHPQQSAQADGPPDYHAYIGWYDPRKSGKLVFPYWRMLREHVASVVTAQGVPLGERLSCGLSVLNWTRKHRYWLGRDLEIAARKAKLARSGGVD